MGKTREQEKAIFAKLRRDTGNHISSKQLSGNPKSNPDNKKAIELKDVKELSKGLGLSDDEFKQLSNKNPTASKVFGIIDAIADKNLVAGGNFIDAELFSEDIFNTAREKIGSKRSEELGLSVDEDIKLQEVDPQLKRLVDIAERQISSIDQASKDSKKANESFEIAIKIARDIINKK